MVNVSNICKAYGAHVLFTNLSVNVGARDRVAAIGPNGSGKTTLFEILAGNVTPDSGSMRMRKDITIGYSKQEVSPFSSESLLDHVVQASTRITGLAHRIEVLNDALAEGGEGEGSDEILHELGELQHKFEAAGGYNVRHEAEVILSGLGFGKKEFTRPLCEFSGGWLMRAGIAKLLVANPDLLLLDEPTNHLDLESCIWFEDYLKSYQGAVLVTSHDRAFLNRVARKIISLEQDDVIFFRGSYDDFMKARQKDLEILKATAKRQEIKLKKEMRFIEKFRYKATKASQVQSRIKRLEKRERVVVPRTTSKIHFAFPEPVRSGEEVVALKHIHKSYDENVVYRDLNLVLRRGDRAALVGANGAGKTTLLKILAGVLDFEGGERKLGDNVETAYYAQYQLELLEAENSVLNELRRVAPAEREEKLRGILGAFLFSGDDVYKKVAVLSGGEKSRLSIAKMLLRPANCLLMDEPTNHLDISSRERLTDALEAYHGTLCFITHDRTLIRQIANKIIEIRNGVPVVYAGNYDEYLAWKEKTAKGEEVDLRSRTDDSSREPSLREIQRRRKAAEGELRNSYYRDVSPIKKRISQIEENLPTLESEFRDLESYFSSPENYGDGAEITAATKRYQELKIMVSQLTDEWAELSMEAERLKVDFNESMKQLESDFARLE